jgi:RNA polymerase sigma-70 factor (ECF subfamily)
MMRTETASTAPLGPRAAFNTTHWSVVLAAARGHDSCAREALARLCQTYWYPLYAYARRRGHSAHDAQDLTQAFFARLLERDSLVSVSPKLGKFRTFILTALKRFLASEWKYAKAQKRGGGRELLSLDWAAAEERFDLEPATNSSPDKLFEKQWAVTVLNDVLRRLEQEYQTDGKAELFGALKQTLMGRREAQPYAALAVKLDMSESAVKVNVHRLRKRYRELMHAEIAGTVEDPREVEEELRYLFQVLAG